jgi:hypothetical protein
VLHPKDVFVQQFVSPCNQTFSDNLRTEVIVVVAAELVAEVFLVVVVAHRHVSFFFFFFFFYLSVSYKFVTFHIKCFKVINNKLRCFLFYKKKMEFCTWLGTSRTSTF